MESLNNIHTHCKICNSEMSVHDNAVVLNKYETTYYICPECGFIQTGEPHWLDEAYSHAITAADTGIMVRNLSNATDLLFFMKFVKNDTCLDFGGGHGILTRIMRDYGYNFFHCDKYAENLFARGFEGDLETKYDLMTSFENFEHFVNPMDEIEKLLNVTDVLYFSTTLLPNETPLVKDWWYYVPNTGQHISFYSKRTLEYIAKKFNMCLLTDNKTTHVLSKKSITKRYFTFLKMYKKIARCNIQWFFKKRPKTYDDSRILRE